jgi:GDP-L-fucose synthase
MIDNSNKKNFNLVFSNWDGHKPLPNGSEFFDLGVEVPLFILQDSRLRPKLHKIEDVTEDEDFYYIIVYRKDLSFYYLNKQRFIIPNDAIKASIEKNMKIILLNEHEINIHEYDVMKILIEQIRIRGLKEENIYYINNNSKLRYYKNRLNTNLNVLTSKFLCNFMCEILVNQPVEFKLKKDFLFLCHNRTMKSHRLLTLGFLKKNNILQDTDYSFVGSTDYAKNNWVSFKKDTYKEYEEDVMFFKNSPNIISKCEQENEDWFVNPNEYHPDKFLNSNCFTNSYINIVTESVFDYDQVHITEKSFRPFYFLQLPIFVASHQHIQYLKKTYNFDFFDDLIDHGYDDEYNHDKRLIRVLAEIKRLHSIKDQVIEFYNKNIDRLIKNSNKIHDLFMENKSLTQLKYIAKMDNVLVPPDPIINNKKVLITGCNGLVGTYLVRKCIEKHYNVVGVDIRDNIHNKDLDFKFIKMDLTKENIINNLFNTEKPDVVLNAFGIKGSPVRAKNNPVDFLYPSFKVNTELINICAIKNIWLIFVSSVGVYSPSESFVEDDVWKTLPSESDWYPSWSKRMGELLLESYNIQYNYENWAIIRPANIFGEFDDFSGKGTVISTMIKKVEEADGYVEAWGDGTPIRDFVYASDVADAIIDMYERTMRKTIVNFGSGEERTISNIVTDIIGVSGKKLDIRWDSTKPNGDLRRKMDTNKQKSLALMPKTKFVEALNKTYHYYLNNKNKS